MVNGYTKRSAVLALIAGAGMAVLAGGASAGADDPMAPEAALARLKSGNARFAADAAAGLPITTQRRIQLAGGQAPYATVLTCADSRVPPEVIFNASLGDLFVVRVAGQVADRAVLASVEYGAEHLHAPVLVVMGHESCGAVKATLEVKESLGPNLDYLIGAIKPAVNRTQASDRERLKAAIFANIDQVVRDTLTKSAILNHLSRDGKLLVAGAYYELASGRVTFSQPLSAAAVPAPAALAHAAPAVAHRTPAPAAVSKAPVSTLPVPAAAHAAH